jgi:hypothetical protein
VTTLVAAGRAMPMYGRPNAQVRYRHPRWHEPPAKEILPARVDSAGSRSRRGQGPIGRRFAAAGHRGWAAFSRVTGVAFLAAFVGIGAGGGNAAANLACTAAVVLMWAWIAAFAGTPAVPRTAPSRC